MSVEFWSPKALPPPFALRGCLPAQMEDADAELSSELVPGVRDRWIQASRIYLALLLHSLASFDTITGFQVPLELHERGYRISLLLSFALEFPGIHAALFL